MEYSVCRAEPQENSDGLNYFTLSWGYDNKEQAVSAMKKIAAEHGLELSDLAVVCVLLGADLEAD